MKNLDVEIIGYKVNSVDKFELVRRVLRAVSTVRDEKIRPAILDVLSFYVIYGYSSETRDLIVDALGITRKNLNQSNAILTKLGYLLVNPNNLKDKLLSKEMLKIKDYFVDRKTPKIMMIKFNNTTGM